MLHRMVPKAQGHCCQKEEPRRFRGAQCEAIGKQTAVLGDNPVSTKPILGDHRQANCRTGATLCPSSLLHAMPVLGVM